MKRLLSTLDLRFTDPEVEAAYYCYYAQVKRQLLPTAIQVVLLVNLLQLLVNVLYYYLLSTDNSLVTPFKTLLPIFVQLTLLVASFTLRRLICAEFDPKRNNEKYNRRRFSSSTSRSLQTQRQQSKDYQKAYCSSGSSNEDDEEDEDNDEDEAASDSDEEETQLKGNNMQLGDLGSEKRKLNSERRENINSSIKPNKKKNASSVSSTSKRKISTSANKLSRCKLSVPYILWFCQLLQLASGLWPQQSFISYSTLLLYSYTIYVIYPIRLMSCIALAITLSASQPIIDYLLMLNASGLTASTSKTTSNDMIGTIDNSLLIPMTSHLSKLWAFMLLTFGINVIGIMSFFFYERQQRAAFLETRQSMETKVTLEQESREQGENTRCMDVAAPTLHQQPRT